MKIKNIWNKKYTPHILPFYFVLCIIERQPDGLYTSNGFRGFYHYPFLGVLAYFKIALSYYTEDLSECFGRGICIRLRFTPWICSKHLRKFLLVAWKKNCKDLPNCCSYVFACCMHFHATYYKLIHVCFLIAELYCYYLFLRFLLSHI